MISKKYALYVGSTKEQPLSWGKVREREEIFTNDQALLFTDRFKDIIGLCNETHPLTGAPESATKNELLQDGFLIDTHGHEKTRQIIDDLFDIITFLVTPENQVRCIYRLTLLILIDQIRKRDPKLNNDREIKKVFLNNLKKIKEDIFADNTSAPFLLTISSTKQCVFIIQKNFLTYIDQLAEEENTEQATSRASSSSAHLKIEGKPPVLSEEDLDQLFRQVIQSAVDDYTNDLQKKGGWTGFFVHHGRKGLEKTASLKEQVIGKNFDQICILLHSFFNNTFTAPQQGSPIGHIMGGTARAHKHSFISFLLEKLKSHPELITKLNERANKQSLPPLNIQNIPDFTQRSADPIRAQAFDFFKTLPLERHRKKRAIE